MNRRNFVQAAGLSGLLACLPAEALAFADEKKKPARATSVKTEIYRLKLRHTWTTTMSSSTYRDVLYVHYSDDGISGVGEGAPIVRYKEDAKGAQAAVNSVLPLLDSSDPTQFEKVISEVFARVTGQWAGKSAIDIALMDWMGKKLG
ncbi:MAG TPA: dipeptide epimerase, partial [Acidobacteriaceae bacterium]